MTSLMSSMTNISDWPTWAINAFCCMMGGILIVSILLIVLLAWNSCCCKKLPIAESQYPRPAFTRRFSADGTICWGAVFVLRALSVGALIAAVIIDGEDNSVADHCRISNV